MAETLPDPRDRKAFERWLANKPREWSVVIAARAALRVVPLVGFNPTKDWSAALISAVFRGTAISCFAARYPSSETLAAAADASHAAIAAAWDVDAFYVAARAADAVYFTGYFACAGDSINAGAKILYNAGLGYSYSRYVGESPEDAADTYASGYRSDFYSIVVNDLQRLGDGFSPTILAQSPLWPDSMGGMPGWARDAWHTIASDLRRYGDHWQVWVDWYNDLLSGRDRGEAWDRAFVDLDTKDPLPWADGAEAVNRRIAERLKKLEKKEPHQEKEEAQDKEQAPPLDVIPTQEPRAFQFASFSEGPIDLAVAADPQERLKGGVDRQEDYAELRLKADELKALGANRLGRLQQPVVRFLDLKPEVAECRLKLFWSRINTLRIFYEDHVRAMEGAASVDHDDRRLDPLAASLLKDLVETLNIFVVGDPGLLDLDAARPGPQEIDIAREEAKIVAPLIKGLSDNADVATRAARDVLIEQQEKISVSNQSVSGQQAAEFGRKTIRNFFSELLRRASASVKQAVASEAGIAWKGVREGAYRAIGAGVAGVVASKAIIEFVVKYKDVLIQYVSKEFQNPVLVDIINWIVRVGS